MKKLFQLVSKLPARAQTRFVRSRPGSVLILVVALLVLMALIGTAYMSMAQDDRASASQHRFNTQVNLLVEGAVNLVKGDLTSDLFVGGKYRAVGTGYTHYSAVGMDISAANAITTATPATPGVVGTPFLADRLPVVPNIGTPAIAWSGGNATTPPGSNPNPAFWTFITAPLIGYQYESPFWPNGPGQPWIYTRDLPTAPTNIIPMTPTGAGMNARMAPSSVTVNGIKYPALVILDANGTPVSPPILAADADGDGIADAGLVKLPIGTLDGLTYYVGARIVDNGAAINANIALAPNTGLATPLGDFFPTNIDLQGLLVQFGNPGGDSLAQMVSYRFNGQGAGTVKPYDDYTLPVTQRTDMTFMGAGFDSSWMQLGRRLDNPGFVTSTQFFQPLSTGDSVGMANRFCLQDPNSLGTPSNLESFLPLSTTVTPTGAYVPLQPYDPGTPQVWFNQNFAYTVGANNMQIRPLLVTKNPVTSFAPLKGNYLGKVNLGAVPAYSGSGYFFGDMVTVHTAAYDRAYVYVGRDGAVTAPIPGAGGGLNSAPARWSWVAEPWSTAPTKISAVTGTFGQLMTAYWNVMSDSTNPLKSGVPTGTDFRQFFSPMRDPNTGMGIATPPQRQPLPATNTDWTLFPSEVIKLRAAIAAVNTMDLRDGDYNVTSRRIVITAHKNGSPAPQSVEATVFGTEAQPYIVEVYAENDNSHIDSTGSGAPGKNPQGYVGVELYNPYPFDIDLTHWSLANLQGRTPAGTPPTLKLVKIGTFDEFTNPNTNAMSQTPVIPAQGYLVIENYDPAGGGAAKDAVYRPKTIDGPLTLPSKPPNYYYVPNLSEVMADPGNTSQPGGELVLLRPRQATLTGTTLTSAFSNVPGEYQETNPAGKPNLYDLVPVDSFDFYGMKLVAPMATQFSGLYYSRALAARTKPDWKFVYPGHWDSATTTHPWPVANGSATYRQEGSIEGIWTSMATDKTEDVKKFSPTPTLWGTDSLTATYPNTFASIQLNNTDFAGPFRAVVGTNQFPFGAFARNGDILQVPYIGAYRLRLLDPTSPIDASGNLVLAKTGNPEEVLELNPVTLDSQQADDYDTYSGGVVDDKFENIGRFCPIDGADTGGATVDDFAPGTGSPVNSPKWRYHWAMRLFNYLTVQSPQDDQFPNADPVAYPISTATTPPQLPTQAVVHGPSAVPPANSYGMVVGGGTTTALADANIVINNTAAAKYNGLPVLFLTGVAQGQIAMINTTGTGSPATMTAIAGKPDRWTIPFDSTQPLTVAPNPGDRFVIMGPPEETASVHGLINVNTASWRVLAAVPMLPNSNGPSGTNVAQNAALAQAIVTYRDVNDGSGATPPHGHGPFKSLFELNKVPGFREALGGSTLTKDFTNAEGDLSPFGGTGDGVTGDFEGTFLMMNRVSNLLTTRSDSYTAYIVIQGWQNAETASPVLKVQRRVAVQLDRSVVTPLVKSPTVINIPMDQ